MVNDDISIITVDIVKDLRTCSIYNRESKELPTVKSLVEEIILALEEAVKNILVDPARKVAPTAISLTLTSRTYMSVAAPQLVKIEMRVHL